MKIWKSIITQAIIARKYVALLKIQKRNVATVNAFEIQ